MPQRCKCKLTGEWGDVERFIKTEYGYFKDEAAYQEWLDAKQKLDKINETRIEVAETIVNGLMGYPEGTPFPSYVFKKIDEFKSYGYDVILETIKYKYSDIKWAMDHKTFVNASQQIGYIFAIISNNIMSIYKRVRAEKEREIRRQKLREEPDLSAEMIVDEINSESPVQKKKNKNLKKFLEEGDDY